MMLHISTRRILAAAVLLASACAHPGDEELGLIATKLGVVPGHTVADVGSGEGEVTVALAESVGDDGRVLATEIDEEAREATAERAKEAGRTNVTVVEATVEDTGLSAGCCEAIVLRRVYHHLTDPAPLLAQLRAALREGGRLLIIDFRPSTWLALSTPEGLPENRSGHGIDPEIVVEEVTAAGFEHVETIGEWPGTWFLDSYAIVFTW